MFYFPIIKGTWPEWSPINAGERFIFFRPVFNLADSAITVGIGIILLFYRSFFNEIETEKKNKKKSEEK
jgi:signal peptidase II